MCYEFFCGPKKKERTSLIEPEDARKKRPYTHRLKDKLEEKYKLKIEQILLVDAKEVWLHDKSGMHTYSGIVLMIDFSLNNRGEFDDKKIKDFEKENPYFNSKFERVSAGFCSEYKATNQGNMEKFLLAHDVSFEELYSEQVGFSMAGCCM